YKLPADPWRIKVRWETAGECPLLLPLLIPLPFPPFSPSTTSQHSNTPAELGKPKIPLPDAEPDAGGSCPFVAMHLDIQIYEMEQGVYLVDFKCSGYETLDRRLLGDKEVMGPFPFLDMAARLIMQLAEAD
ncbi:hypothetical protein IMZ48_31520, partial [Candidatus Bathyarchaeota archaeon]|nr:hypothetical protein [Candidatus Bathyarchaeota archaeon]